MQKDTRTYFETEIAILYDDIIRSLMHLGCEASIAEDMAQETMKKAWENIQHLMDIDYATNWLYTVARNNFYSYARLAFHKYEYTEADFSLSDYECSKIEHDIANFIAKQESYDILENSLDLLEPKYSDLIRMRYFGELSYHEISEQLALNENTARSTVSRGLSKLKKILIKQGYMKEVD